MGKHKLTLVVLLSPRHLQALEDYRETYNYTTRYAAAEGLLIRTLDQVRTVDSVARRWAREEK